MDARQGRAERRERAVVLATIGFVEGEIGRPGGAERERERALDVEPLLERARRCESGTDAGEALWLVLRRE